MRLRSLAAATAAAALLLTGATTASAGGHHHDDLGLTRQDRADLHRWAADTWTSFVAMTDETTGLPADNIDATLDPATRSGYTSPTNIGAYLWSTISAEELGVISKREARERLRQTLATVATMERHEPSGMFYNWYDEATGAKLTQFPTGETVYPFLSTVDNGWMAAALMVVATAEPSLRRQANALLEPMNFGAFYDADQFGGTRPGMMRGGFWVDPPVNQCTQAGTVAGSPVLFTCHHYDITNSEPRIASYIGIVRGQVPPAHYFATNRTFPASCDWDWLEQRPVGVTRTYEGLEVFEGAFTYRGMHIVPSWGGDMFEELMPDLFVPESEWAPKSWGVNHPLAVRAHIEHGLVEAGYGYWGFSPASDPFGTYSVYGVDAIGMDPGGYPSDAEKTNVDAGYEGCREATNPTPTFGDGVVTPHASFLALPYAPREAVDNLRNIETVLGAYGDGGFYDSVAVRSNTQAKRYLSLDQGMVLGALGNVLGGGVLHDSFGTRQVEKVLRPLIGQEEFSAGVIK
ncbi:cellobiose phosphorylase [Cellulomonas sp. Root485]|uniref:glucoamylase family protein n=1 Tax=Cellulomonas sp. Root485 TaxID=1736546 RepID=UPI0006FABF43|nr:glucoamylase family protein [Cellulomonas sp. Root485]KQY21767.1 cellobiose phosphorylase [Cellulomonas sp. Root485]